MNRHRILVASLFTFLFVGLGISNLYSQRKCSGTVLALNMTPVKISEKRIAVKTPCDNKGKRINQSPQKATVESMGYYNNVTIDQLGETFINSFPGLASGTPVQKPCPSKIKDTNKKLAACRSEQKEKCDPKVQEQTPKRLRPSATVKLAKYEVEQ